MKKKNVGKECGILTSGMGKSAGKGFVMATSNDNDDSKISDLLYLCYTTVSKRNVT